jgi:hypothetical protein
MDTKNLLSTKKMDCNNSNFCIKCNSKLKYLRYCLNKNCKHFLTNEDINEHLWNLWAVSYIDGAYDEKIKQIFKSDL